MEKTVLLQFASVLLRLRFRLLMVCLWYAYGLLPFRFGLLTVCFTFAYLKMVKVTPINDLTFSTMCQLANLPSRLVHYYDQLEIQMNQLAVLFSRLVRFFTKLDRISLKLLSVVCRIIVKVLIY